MILEAHDPINNLKDKEKAVSESLGDVRDRWGASRSSESRGYLHYSSTTSSFHTQGFMPQYTMQVYSIKSVKQIWPTSEFRTHPLSQSAYYFNRQLSMCNRSTSPVLRWSIARSRFLRACRSARRLRTATAATGRDAVRTAMRRRRFGTRAISGSNSVSRSAVGGPARLRLRLRSSSQGCDIVPLSGKPFSLLHKRGRMYETRTVSRRWPCF